jgi:tripartite-type tricarboxylate transporter receptor subunit TctC
MRQMSVHLSTILGQPVVIENRPGAATRIAAEAVAKAASDGYTFLVGTPSLTTMSALYPKMAFDPKRDLVPVGLASITNYTLAINAAVPAQTLAEFVKLNKADSRYTNFGTLGVGAINHLTGAWFASLSGADVNFVHYNMSGPFTDLVSGQIPATFDAMLPLIGHVKSGKVRFLGISGKTRHPLIPDVPTFAEAGMPTLDPLVWIGLLAPAGTPQPIVNRMSTALSQVAKMPDIAAQRRAAGSKSMGTTPEEFAAFLDTERTKWGGVIQKIGLTLE